MTPTDPTTFHAALRQLLADHAVAAMLGPRCTTEGVPVDDIEGAAHAVPRTRVTTLNVYSTSPNEVLGSAWWAQLHALPGVRPYPTVVAHALGGALVTVRWLDATPNVERPTFGGPHLSI